MPQNAYLIAKIGADTAENEGNVADILPKKGSRRRARRAAGRASRAGRPPRAAGRTSAPGTRSLGFYRFQLFAMTLTSERCLLYFSIIQIDGFVIVT